MTIKVWDYSREYEAEKKEVLATIQEVLESGQLILGENVKAFESEFAQYCDVSYGIGVASGTDALFLSLKALGIGVGDEVITVSNTAVPTVSAIVSTGAIPKFVDINPSTYLIDVENIEGAITCHTRCILPVHLFGQCADMDRIRSIAKKNNLFVVEDCAQAHFAKYKDELAGSMSDLGAFSFYPTKLLGAYGDGGIIITSQKVFESRLRRLRFYGMEKSYYANEHGYNSRLDELHAAILRKKLSKLNSYIKKRRLLAERYNQELADTSLVLPTVAENCSHSYYLYVCRHPNRDKIITDLRHHEIYLNVSYPWPIHIMEGYGYLGYQEGDLPHTEKAAKEIFSLPMYPTLSFAEQDRFISVLSNQI